jgi:DNA primase catalytic core
MPRVPDELIERIKAEVLVETLARRAGVELKPHGENLVGFCVFHPDRNTPNLVITPAKNVYHCFACGAAGSPIDWVMQLEGVRVRAALEILLLEFFPLEARTLGIGTPPKKSTVPKLPAPFDAEASEEEIVRGVVSYYHGKLGESPDALAFLAKRGIDTAEVIGHFQLGFSDRTLGLRIPLGNRKAGAAIRTTLQKLGFYRPTAREHFVGCLVFPLFDEAGHVAGMYGRRIDSHLPAEAPRHLYLPGPHRGVLNRQAFEMAGSSRVSTGSNGGKEVILCEAPIDAATFFRWGFRNVTTAYGVEGFTDELLRAFVSHGIERCLIAYDHDEAGDRGARKAAEKLTAEGVECFRVLFPKGMDANEYALKVQPGDESLGALLRGAEWMGSGGNGAPPSRTPHDGAPPNGTPHDGAPPNGAPSHRGGAREAAPQPTRSAPAPAVAANGSSPRLAREAGASSSSAAEDGPGGAAEEGEVILNGSNGPEPACEGPAPSRVDRFPRAGAYSDPITEDTEPLVEPSSPALEASAPSAGAPTSSTMATPPPPGVPLTTSSATTTPVTPPSPSLPLAPNGDDEAVFRFEDRSYRVRGLKKALQSGSLAVVVHAEREGDFFGPTSPISGSFLDRFDFVSALARSRFEKSAAHELGVKPEVVKWDLGQVLRRLEELQRKAREEALKPKSLVPPMTEAQRAEGLEYGRAPGLVERILLDFESSGVVGEVTNKLVGYLGGVSRLSERPLAIIIRSSSAAGKTALMDAILRFVPKESREKYSALSGHALFYFEGKDFRHKVLAIVEEEGAQRASYALKLLQSDGEITIASTGKDPGTGRLATKEYQVEGPLMIFLASTAVEIDEELLNRAVVLTIDEGREQTRAIHRLQREGQTLEGLWAREEREEIYARHHRFQRLLRQLPVVNPYVRELTFLDEKTRTRRDHTKYLGLIEASALLHQHQRAIKTDTKNGKTKEYVEVDLYDVALANRLAAEVLGRSLDELPPQTRKLLLVLDELVTRTCRWRGVDRSDLRFTLRDVRQSTGFSHDQLWRHMQRLVTLEYLLVHRGSRGQTFVYELLYDGQGKEGERFVIGLADVEALARARGIDPPKLPDVWAQEPEATSTTPTSAGQEGTSAGVSRPHSGAFRVGSAGAEILTKPAPEAAFLGFEAKPAENAHLEPGPKSYAQGGRSDTEAGQDVGQNADRGAGRTAVQNAAGNGAGLRVNLLRFPPVAKRCRSAAPAATSAVLPSTSPAPQTDSTTAPAPRTAATTTTTTTSAPIATPPASPASPAAPAAAPVLALPKPGGTKPGGNGRKPHGRLLLRRAASSFSRRVPQSPRGLRGS